MNEQDLDLSVVIPAYRSAGTLALLNERLVATLDSLQLTYELVYVDDGSPDESWQVLQELHRAHPHRITAIQLNRNFGQHNALMCGFRHCRGRYVITMDDDLQNPPSEIPKLLASIRSRGLDVVYGNPDHKSHQTWRNLGSRLINFFYRSVFRNAITVSSFRIIDNRVLSSMFSYDLNFTFVDGLLAWNTTRIGSIEVAHHSRERGRSGYSLGKLMTLAFNLFTNFSLWPLQLVSLLGLVTASLGLGAAAIYLLLYLSSNIAVPGYASVIIAVLVLGGIQLISLGIMGEYLGRLHLNVNKKPQYTTRDVIAAKPLEPGRRESFLLERQLNSFSGRVHEVADVAGSATRDHEDIQPIPERTLRMRF